MQDSDSMYRLASQVRAEIEAHLDPACKIDKSWKRNASLALVKLAFEGCGSSSTDDNLSYRVTVVTRYLQEYANASTAYNDLRPFVAQLSQDERKQLLDVLDQKAASQSVSHPSDLSTGFRCPTNSFLVCILTISTALNHSSNHRVS